MKIFLKKFYLNLICICLLNNISFSSDYCGQPIPHDIAQEGYNKMIDNAFADPSSGGAGNNNFSNNGQMTTLQGQVISVPPGASIPVVLDRAIGSGFSREGEILYAYLNGMSFGLPQGTVAELTVLMIEPASRVFAKPGRLQLGANRLILPNGQSVWLKGLVVDNKGQTALKGQSTARRVGNSFGKMALGAGVGAAGGVSAAYMADGKTGTGALVGTVIGTVIGGIWAASTKGQDIILPTGTEFYLNVLEGTQAYF